MLQPNDFSKLRDHVGDVVSQLKTQLETKPNVDNVDFESIIQDLLDIKMPDMSKVVSGALHRLSLPMSYILAGNTNAGKTAVTRQLFLDMAVRFRYGDEVLPVNDSPDLTRSLVQIPFGRGENPEGERLMLFDTPGLIPDDDRVGNIARAALGLDQVGSDEEKLASIPITSLGPPDKDGVANVVVEEQISLEELDSILNRDRLGCIYVARATETPLQKKAIEDDLDKLRKLFGERLITVLTFEDKLEEWPEQSQERRRELLDEALSGDFTSVNGLTGDGKSQLAHRLLLAHGYARTDLLSHLQVETKCSLLFDASDQIAAIIAAALFSDGVNSLPRERLLPAILLVGSMAIHLIYGPTKDKWQELSGDAKKMAVAIEENFVEEEWSIAYRAPRGLIEHFRTIFSWVIAERRITEVVRANPDVLAMFYSFLYSCIYDLEAKSEPKVLITTKIPEEEAIKNFKNLFEPHKVLLEKPDAWQLYRIGSQVLSKFWESHHPEVLPTERPSPLEMDKI